MTPEFIGSIVFCKKKMIFTPVCGTFRRQYSLGVFVGLICLAPTQF